MVEVHNYVLRFEMVGVLHLSQKVTCENRESTPRPAFRSARDVGDTSHATVVGVAYFGPDSSHRPPFFHFFSPLLFSCIIPFFSRLELLAHVSKNKELSKSVFSALLRRVSPEKDQADVGTVVREELYKNMSQDIPVLKIIRDISSPLER